MYIYIYIYLRIYTCITNRLKVSYYFFLEKDGNYPFLLSSVRPSIFPNHYRLLPYPPQFAK